jgi:hypothetical protein
MRRGFGEGSDFLARGQGRGLMTDPGDLLKCLPSAQGSCMHAALRCVANCAPAAIGSRLTFPEDAVRHERAAQGPKNQPYTACFGILTWKCGQLCCPQQVRRASSCLWLRALKALLGKLAAGACIDARVVVLSVDCAGREGCKLPHQLPAAPN